MKKQSWLQPISKEDVYAFAREHMNMRSVQMVQEHDDEIYGKFYEVSGISNDKTLDLRSMQYNDKLILPVGLGEYGLVSVDPYDEGSSDEPKAIFGEDAETINTIVNWIMLVSSKNEGRTIEGKTYPESVSEVYGKYIELSKRVQMNAIETQASERKACIEALTKQLTKGEQGKAKQ